MRDIVYKTHKEQKEYLVAVDKLLKNLEELGYAENDPKFSEEQNEVLQDPEILEELAKFLRQKIKKMEKLFVVCKN